MKTSILHSYIETALWSSHCDYETGETFQAANYDLSDVTEETLIKCTYDLVSFFEVATVTLGNAFSELDDEQVAHDFWLTRNGHGAGFWDGDYDVETGKTLTKLSKMFGEVNLYLNDAQQIEME